MRRMKMLRHKHFPVLVVKMNSLSCRWRCWRSNPIRNGGRVMTRAEDQRFHHGAELGRGQVGVIVIGTYAGDVE
jgi:hypothetical protein